MATVLLEDEAITGDLGYIMDTLKEFRGHDEDVLWAANMALVYLGHDHHQRLYRSEIIESAKRLDVTPAEFVEAYGEAVARLNESKHPDSE